MFDERVLKHKPWSISKANMLDLCLAQYNKKYNERAPEGRKSTQSLVGTVSHAVLEAARRNTHTVDSLTEEAKVLFEKDKLTHTERGEVCAKIPAILDYVARVNAFKVQHAVKLELIEEKLSMTADFGKASFFDNKNSLLRGVIDDALWTGDDVLVIIDHKSGRKKPIQEHSTQFYAYMALAAANFPELRGFQPAINYFGEPRLQWFPRFDGTSGAWSREEVERHVFPWIETFLNRKAKRLALLDAGAAEPQTGWQCEYCGFVDSCAEGSRHAAERKAKRDGTATHS